MPHPPSEAFIAQAAAEFPADFFTREPADLAEYGRDFTRVYAPAPSVIALPRTTEQTALYRQVLDAARARGCDLPLVVHIPSEPPLPFGGW